MSELLKDRLVATLIRAVKESYGLDLGEIVSERPPEADLGDLAFPTAFELARRARTAPRKIAETLEPALRGIDGVERVEVAGAGYLNVFFDRRRYLEEFLAAEGALASRGEKIIVEHTNINPNKAAHIGHLRNAALGDSFVRALRHTGREVEVQNYIDDTGVQVADVVVGFLHIERRDEREVRALVRENRFDYYCWDLYARVSDFYQEDAERLRLREQTLKAIEENEAPEAPLGALISEEIVRCHLATMQRIDVRYDLLPAESDILKMRFWERAFELLREKQAIRYSSSGKNAGCWVMDLGESEEDEKVIVRSNGTVTYVGKDIAYQMWKLGLLDRQFRFRPFHRYPDGHIVWSTTSESDGSVGEEVPSFGNGATVYNVIDVRQAYLQKVVQKGVSLLASEDAGLRSRHFSYEMVALTPSTCRELGFPVSPEEEKRPYLEVSGRRGLGVKADDLIDALVEKARREVDSRNAGLAEEERAAIAEAIARGALRYFLIKYTKNKVIAFDFAEALSFDGDSGPYVQYAVVRAGKILARLGQVSGGLEEMEGLIGRGFSRDVPTGEADELWSMILAATELDDTIGAVIRTEEPSHLTRFALSLAQRFNAIYHRYRVVEERDEAKRALRTLAVQIFHRQLTRALSLMGVPVPERM
ncbi:MAG TPA: arginine--tRNA ligase [Vicinamibacteria bacterium]|nr:arginine--tRNA ligase [Vicinamibacteria bacterium]